MTTSREWLEARERYLGEQRAIRLKAAREASPWQPPAAPDPAAAAFRDWLKNRIESVGYNVENAPDYLRLAYLSGNPKDLNALVWGEWYDHNKQGFSYEDATEDATCLCIAYQCGRL